MFSALKKDGVRLYKLARAGKQIEILTRRVVIHRFRIKEINLPDVDFEVSCSKGTYIRSLAFDFGKALGSGAYLAALRREKIGEFQLSDAWNLPDLIEKIKEQSHEYRG